MKKIEHEFFSLKIDYVIADSEKVNIRFKGDIRNVFLYKNEIEAIANKMGHTLLKLPANKTKQIKDCPHCSGFQQLFNGEHRSDCKEGER